MKVLSRRKGETQMLFSLLARVTKSTHIKKVKDFKKAVTLPEADNYIFLAN